MDPPPLPLRKRFPWILYWIVLALVILIAFAPIGSVLACSVIANARGCKVDEGSVHPCIVNGHDYGHLLYTLGMMDWLMLVTIPGGLIASGIWLVVLTAPNEMAKTVCCRCWLKRFVMVSIPRLAPDSALLWRQRT